MKTGVMKMSVRMKFYSSNYELYIGKDVVSRPICFEGYEPNGDMLWDNTHDSEVAADKWVDDEMDELSEMELGLSAEDEERIRFNLMITASSNLNDIWTDEIYWEE